MRQGVSHIIPGISYNTLLMYTTPPGMFFSEPIFSKHMGGTKQTLSWLWKDLEIFPQTRRSAFALFPSTRKPAWKFVRVPMGCGVLSCCVIPVRYLSNIKSSSTNHAFLMFCAKDFVKSWKTSAVSTTVWMVETQLCKLRGTSDMFV